jgi:hypothetical protein
MLNAENRAGLAGLQESFLGEFDMIANVARQLLNTPDSDGVRGSTRFTPPNHGVDQSIYVPAVPFRRANRG